MAFPPPFDPSQHPRGYHGMFAPTSGQSRSPARTLAAAGPQPMPGATRSYGGIAIQPAATMAATISYQQPPELTPGTVHVAPWLGVSNGKTWLQTGIAFTTGPGVLYMEATLPDGQYVFKPLGQAQPGVGYRFQIVKRPGNVYVAFLDGRRVGTVRVPGASVGQATVETEFGANQAGSAASYRFSFRDVSVGGYSHMPAPVGEAGAQVQVTGGRSFDAFSGAAPVAKQRDDSRSVFSIRKRAYPVLVRAHVRGGSTLPTDVQAELRRWFLAHPDERASEAAEHGADPLKDMGHYLAAERAEGYHPSLNVSPLTVAAVKQWEREETAEPVAKDQPDAGDVHVDSATDIVSVGPVDGKKRRKQPETLDEPDLEVHVLKADKAKQLLYGIVLEPHRVDSQGDWEDHGDIEDACHRYMGLVFKDGVTDLVNLQHRDPAPPSVYPVENYIAPTDFVLNGEPVQKGSWVLVVKVGDPQVWQDVLDGKWGGLSVEGTGRRRYDLPAPPQLV